MQEAKFSLNIRFNFKGYDSQFTMRDDENGAPLLDKFVQVIDRLEKMGALPERRWEAAKNGNGNGNGHAVAAAAAPATPAPKPEPPKAEFPKGWKGETTPTCRSCNSSESMELVEFTKDGVDKKAWKCQDCKKWHYDKKGK
jgi:hypothetical protein